MFGTRFLSALLLTAALATAVNGQPAQVPVPPVNALLPCLDDENVQKELKLTADQSKKLLAFRQKQWDEAYTTPPKGLDFAARTKATEAEFKEVLSADQFKRANQIAVQYQWSNRGFRRFGGFPGGGTITLPAADPSTAPTSVLSQYPAIAEALKLDETQKKLVPSGTFGGPFGSEVYLTPAQVTTVKELLGAPYKGTFNEKYDPRLDSLDPRSIGGRRFGGQFGGLSGPPAVQYATAKDVRAELKLTEEQIKALAALQAKWAEATNPQAQQSATPEAFKKAIDKLTTMTDKELDTLLTAEQRKRLGQIERQENPTDIYFAGSAIGKELGVDAAQIKKHADLSAAREEAITKAALSGESLEKIKAAVEAAEKDFTAAVATVLTPDQKDKQKDLLGTPFTGRTFDGGGLDLATMRKFQFGRYGTELATLNLKSVQEHLKLTEEQLKKLAGSRAELAEKFPVRELNAARQDPVKGDKIYAERSAFVEAALQGTLTKEQFARFRELMLQQLESPVGPRNAANIGAAGYPGVAEAIKLTAEQKDKLLTAPPPFAGPSPDVLTAEQKKVVKEMQGTPVDVATMFPRKLGDPARALISPTAITLLSTSVWAELKLTPEQVTKLATAANEYTLVANTRPTFGGPPNAAFPTPPTQKEIDAAVVNLTAVPEVIFTPAQKKRLEQIVLQREISSSLVRFLVGMPALGGAAPTVTTVNAAKALGLTDEQRKSISALGTEATQISALVSNSFQFRNVTTKIVEYYRGRILKELTAEQRAKLDELKGAPFTETAPTFGFGGFGGPGGGGFGGPGGILP